MLLGLQTTDQLKRNFVIAITQSQKHKWKQVKTQNGKEWSTKETQTLI